MTRAPGRVAQAGLTAALLLLVLVGVRVAVAESAGQGRGVQPWELAEEIRSSLFGARSELLLEGAAAERDVAAAEQALRGPLRAGLEDGAPGELAELERAIDDSFRAVAAEDPVALAAAYGEALSALRHGAFELAIAAARDDRPTQARQWLLIRDFRQATRYTRPAVDATAALDALGAGETTPDDAVLALRKDLYDAYQSRLASFLDEARIESGRGYLPAVAESAAMARGYWEIIAGEYEAQRGAAARERGDRIFDELASSVGSPAFGAAEVAAHEQLARFVAAPLTAEEQVRRAAQLTRFLDLIPIEYDDGTDDGRVTIPFEIQEGIAFSEGARAALADLAAPLEQRDEAALTELEDTLAELEGYAREASEGGEVADLETVEAAHDRARAIVDGLFPAEWLESNDEADYDLIQISLDQMEAAVSAGERDQAEQARLTAYAFFEFGPEIKLRAFDPGLTAEVEGLIWYGARGVDGLAEQIAGDRPITDIKDTRLVLDEALDEAKAKTGEGESAGTVISNAALIVFREGLEAILIIAAITASMIGPNRRLRRPVMRGALLALPASALLFVAAVLLLDTLSQYGEKLEAAVGIVAIGVLLLVLNWFFHKVYWTEWIASHRRRGKALLAGGAAIAGASTVAGLYVLGFTSVFREGFETVLFLQALQLSSGIGVVGAGVSLGLLATAAVGYATFALERKLPYKKMLIVTGALIALVLVVLVGNTVRTLQGVGWMPITPLDVEFPLWMGTWLGIFPTVETLAAQALALAFVLGSYFLAEWVSKRRLKRLIAAAEAKERAEGRDPAEAPVELDREAVRAEAQAYEAAETDGGRARAAKEPVAR